MAARACTGLASPAPPPARGAHHRGQRLPLGRRDPRPPHRPLGHPGLPDPGRGHHADHGPVPRRAPADRSRSDGPAQRLGHAAVPAGGGDFGRVPRLVRAHAHTGPRPARRGPAPLAGGNDLRRPPHPGPPRPVRPHPRHGRRRAGDVRARRGRRHHLRLRPGRLRPSRRVAGRLPRRPQARLALYHRHPCGPVPSRIRADRSREPCAPPGLRAQHGGPVTWPLGPDRGPLRAAAAAHHRNSNHRNHTVQTRALHGCLRRPNARHPDVLAAERRERARIHSGIRWGGRPGASAA